MSAPKICGFMSSISHAITVTRIAGTASAAVAAVPTTTRSTFGVSGRSRSPAP